MIKPSHVLSHVLRQPARMQSHGCRGQLSVSVRLCFKNRLGVSPWYDEPLVLLVVVLVVVLVVHLDRDAVPSMHGSKPY